MSAGCPRLFEVEALRDGRLEGAERSRFEQHLRGCSTCSSETRALDALGEALRADTAPNDQLHVRRERLRLLAAFDRSLVEQGTSRSRRGFVATAAALVLVALVAVWLIGVPQQSVPGPSAIVHASEAASWSRTISAQRELLRLDHGELWIHVAEGPNKQPLLLKLPDGELEDIGTIFSVSVENQRTIYVKVEEGRVLLRLAGRDPIVLDAGQSWSAEETTAAHTAHPAKESAPSEPAQPAPTPVPSLGRAAPAPGQAVEPSPDAASLDFKRAVATLNAGHHAQAAVVLQRFIAKYPADSRAEDAAYLRVLALQRSGNHEATQAAARDYLRRHPSGFRRAEVERLLQSARPIHQSDQSPAASGW